MWQEIAIGLGLVLIIEGMLPFLSPQKWLQMLAQIAQMNDNGIRLAGLMSMSAGLILLIVVN